MQEFRSKKVILCSVTVAGLYVLAAIYLMNAGLVLDTLFGNYSLAYKWNLMVALLEGMWTAMSVLSLFLLVVVALLTGMNVALTARRFKRLRSSGKLSLAVGGSSLVGIVGSGCASCGLPILALMGLGGAVAYLPFQGLELSLLAIILLSFSIYLLLTNNTPQKCLIKVN